jgi:hypothetical protein
MVFMRLMVISVSLSFGIYASEKKSSISPELEIKKSIERLNKTLSSSADGFLKQFEGAQKALEKDKNKDIAAYQKNMEQRSSEMQSVIGQIKRFESFSIRSSFSGDEIKEISKLQQLEQQEGTRFEILNLVGQLTEKNILKHAIASPDSVNYIKKALASIVSYTPGIGGFEDVGGHGSLAASYLELGEYKDGLNHIIEAAKEGKTVAPRHLMENQNQFPFTTLQDQIDFMKEKEWSLQDQASFLQLASIFYHYNEKNLEKVAQKRLAQLIHNNKSLGHVKVAPYVVGGNKFYQLPYVGSGLLPVESVKKYKDQSLQQFLKDFCSEQLVQLKKQNDLKSDLETKKRYENTALLCNNFGFADASNKDVKSSNKKTDAIAIVNEKESLPTKFVISTDEDIKGGTIKKYAGKKELTSSRIIYEKKEKMFPITPVEEKIIPIKKRRVLKKVLTEREKLIVTGNQPVSSPILEQPTTTTTITTPVDLSASVISPTTRTTPMQIETPEIAKRDAFVLTDVRVKAIHSWPKNAEKAKITALQLLAAYDYNKKSEDPSKKFSKSKEIFNELYALRATLPPVHEELVEINGEQVLQKFYTIESLGKISETKLDEYGATGDGNVLEGFCKSLADVRGIMKLYETSMERYGENPQKFPAKDNLLNGMKRNRDNFNLCAYIGNKSNDDDVKEILIKYDDWIQRLEGKIPASTVDVSAPSTSANTPIPTTTPAFIPTVPSAFPVSTTKPAPMASTTTSMPLSERVAALVGSNQLAKNDLMQIYDILLYNSSELNEGDREKLLDNYKRGAGEKEYAKLLVAMTGKKTSTDTDSTTSAATTTPTASPPSFQPSTTNPIMTLIVPSAHPTQTSLVPATAVTTKEQEELSKDDAEFIQRALDDNLSRKGEDDTRFRDILQNKHHLLPADLDKKLQKIFKDMTTQQDLDDVIKRRSGATSTTSISTPSSASTTTSTTTPVPTISSTPSSTETTASTPTPTLTIGTPTTTSTTSSTTTATSTPTTTTVPSSIATPSPTPSPTPTSSTVPTSTTAQISTSIPFPENENEIEIDAELDRLTNLPTTANKPIPTPPTTGFWSTSFGKGFSAIGSFVSTNIINPFRGFFSRIFGGIGIFG